MSMQNQGGTPPGKVTVPSSTKGRPDTPMRFGEPNMGVADNPGMSTGEGNGGDPPTVVTVPAGTRGRMSTGGRTPMRKS